MPVAKTPRTVRAPTLGRAAVPSQGLRSCADAEEPVRDLPQHRGPLHPFGAVPTVPRALGIRRIPPALEEADSLARISVQVDEGSEAGGGGLSEVRFAAQANALHSHARLDGRAGSRRGVARVDASRGDVRQRTRAAGDA